MTMRYLYKSTIPLPGKIAVSKYIKYIRLTGWSIGNGICYLHRLSSAKHRLKFEAKFWLFVRFSATFVTYFLSGSIQAGQKRLAVREITSTLRKITCHIEITQCYLPPGNGNFPTFTAAAAGIRFSDPWDARLS